MTRTIVLGLLVLSIAAAAGAEQQKDLARERVQLLFKEVPVTNVLPALAKSLGYELQLDPNLRALVTIEVQNVTAETALNAICESIGCRWRREGTRLIVEARTDVLTTFTERPKGEAYRRGGGNLFNYGLKGLDDELPFDVTWSPIDLHTAFYMLARMMDADVDLAPALQSRKLAVSFKGESLRKAFDAVCAVAGCQWQLLEQPKRVVRVTERSDEQSGPTASGAIRVYKPGEGVIPPVVVINPKPQYTREAMQAKIEGSVWLECVVLPDGTVGDVHIVRSLDREHGLDEEALKAARAWRFKPGMKDGHPVPVMITLELKFTLR